MAAEAPRPTGRLVKPPELWFKKWYDRARTAGPFYEAGIKAPRRNPIEAAISMKETLMAKMADRSTWDKWEERLRSVGFEGWQKAALAKGVKRFTDGIEFGKDKFRDFAEQFAKHLEEGLRKVLTMPKRNLEEAIARAAEMIRWNAKFRYRPRK